uniref:Putative potassium transporter 2 n=1 Tax=Saccharum hybrid cultivar R570 TaxID=131158 RepID=A0A059Q1D5_9POAL|nr:putative potassium transporter 2 [Saccharum hybrid cultivar R570]
MHQDMDSFVRELVESLATFIKLHALFRCSDADDGEQRDNNYYERENALMVIGSNLLRRHLGLGLRRLPLSRRRIVWL